MPKLTPEQKAKKQRIAEKLKIRNLKAKTKRQFKRSKLIEEADRVLSLYIRFVRDKEKPCITCWEYAENYDCWHYQSRRFINTRWSEQNVAKQCCRCNKWMSWEQVIFGRRIDEIWWEGTSEALEIYARKLSEISDEDILHTIRVYYSLLSQQNIDFKPKKQFYETL